MNIKITGLLSTLETVLVVAERTCLRGGGSSLQISKPHLPNWYPNCNFFWQTYIQWQHTSAMP